MIFLILVGAALFNFFIEENGMTQALVNWITTQGFSPLSVILILLVSVVEIGLIAPPIGMNLFVIQGVSPTLTIGKVSRGILPFIAADVVRVFLILLLPTLVLWLPNWLGLG